MSTKLFLVCLVVLVAAVCAKDAAKPHNAIAVDQIKPANSTGPAPLPPTKAAPIVGKEELRRDCMNQCGGLCRQLCAKFKALKVCNGCVRGCLNKCGTGVVEPVSYNPFEHPKPQHH